MARIDGKVFKTEDEHLYKIHNVHIVDASGSMQGSKYDNAIKGLNSEIDELKANKQAEYTQTVIEFSGARHKQSENNWITGECDLNIMPHYFMVDIKKVEYIHGFGADSITPLLQTVGRVIEALVNAKAPEDRVVVKIFTDRVAVPMLSIKAA